MRVGVPCITKMSRSACTHFSSTRARPRALKKPESIHLKIPIWTPSVLPLRNGGNNTTVVLYFVGQGRTVSQNAHGTTRGTRYLVQVERMRYLYQVAAAAGQVPRAPGQ